ncbi:MAG: DUF6285 domain-containing protein [Gammaproteobacteria bacterium]|nr:DUF6285 domain-containing protein [Gammaproteobacteria bacterium]MDH5171272.1 DUF6285 domain-containing protein [Gammaproteobacteria bacterium]
MSETRADELLLAVQAFLRSEVLPQLEGFTAYNTRVAANSLAIVARELQLGPELDALDDAIASLLGLDPAAGPIPQQVALGLRNGELVPDATLLDYLRQRALKALEIDNPKYSGYLQACERWRADRRQ